MVIDTLRYYHRDRLSDRSHPGIRNRDTGALLSFPLFCQRGKRRNAFAGGAHGRRRPATSRLHQNKRDTGFLRPQTDLPTDFTRKKGCLLYQSLHRRNYRHRRWKMRLHRWLLDEYKRDGSFAWGKTIVGYSTLVLAIIIISGLVIWYPRNKKALKNRLKIKTKAGWFRFLYDLHVSGGFYAALLLLILALTGLTWSFGWYRDAFYTAFGISTTSKQTHAPTSAVPPKTAGERGSKKHPKTDYTQWAEVLANLQSRYPEYKSISIQDGSATVSTAAYGNTRGSDRYSFDPATGKITEIQLYKDLPKSAKIRGWIYSVHAGTWGGLTTRILSCLVSLLGAVFAITGYYFWIKKKLRKSKQR